MLPKEHTQRSSKKKGTQDRRGTPKIPAAHVRPYRSTTAVSPPPCPTGNKKLAGQAAVWSAVRMRPRACSEKEQPQRAIKCSNHSSLSRSSLSHSNENRLAENRSTLKGSSTIQVHNKGTRARHAICDGPLYKTSDVIADTQHGVQEKTRKITRDIMFIRAPRVDVVACSGADAPFDAAVGSPSTTTLDPLRPHTLSLLSFPVGPSPSPLFALKVGTGSGKENSRAEGNQPKLQLVTICSLLL